MYEGRRVNVDPFGVPAATAIAVVADIAVAKVVVADDRSVCAATLNVALNYKEPETGAVHPIRQLVDSVEIDSDPLWNEYLAHGTGQIKQPYLVCINLRFTS
ncbi:hypothetical protein EGR_08971 [Echinococcus granulosus]|uniref:Uncharacterized protein n=1 Tax=Echinococcus granulosus TaxID=6210 RepID=W6U717_ECHGR|nr:hypothetical protein EGR_08971 [Echinococcus granulosus]EUB56166.1 hypothetical protein EGR_08971 [Echinococcus granulosus]